MPPPRTLQLLEIRGGPSHYVAVIGIPFETAAAPIVPARKFLRESGESMRITFSSDIGVIERLGARLLNPLVDAKRQEQVPGSVTAVCVAGVEKHHSANDGRARPI